MHNILAHIFLLSSSAVRFTFEAFIYFFEKVWNSSIIKNANIYSGETTFFFDKEQKFRNNNNCSLLLYGTFLKREKKSWGLIFFYSRLLKPSTWRHSNTFYFSILFGRYIEREFFFIFSSLRSHVVITWKLDRWSQLLVAKVLQFFPCQVQMCYS